MRVAQSGEAGYRTNPVFRSAHEDASTTTTDLGCSGVLEIPGKLRQLLGDVFTLYVKGKNFPWHISMRRFRNCHRFGGAVRASGDAHRTSSPQREDEINVATRNGQVPRAVPVAVLEGSQIRRAIDWKEGLCGRNGKL